MCVPASESTDKTLALHDVDEGRVQVRYTPRNQIANKLSATYNRYWSGYDKEIESDRDVVPAEDADSISAYGERSESYSFPYIPGGG